MSILSERIRSYEWKYIERLNNVEEAYKEFNVNLKLMFDESCPNKTVKIKKLDTKKPHMSEIKRLIRAIIDDLVVIAKAFNNYFSNIGSNLGDRFEQNEEYRQYLNMNVVTEFNFSPVTRENTIRIAMSFKDSSPDIDDIPMRIIKENIANLSDVLCFICNK